MRAPHITPEDQKDIDSFMRSLGMTYDQAWAVMFGIRYIDGCAKELRQEIANAK